MLLDASTLALVALSRSSARWSAAAGAIAAWLVNRRHTHLHALFLETLTLIGGASLLWNSWR